MRLRLGVSAPGGPEQVLGITADPASTASELVTAIATTTGAGGASWWNRRTARPLDLAASLGASGLCDGDELVAGEPPTATHPSARPAIAVLVTGGSAAGRRVDLPIGSHLVGRDPVASVLLDDDAVSWQHAEIVVEAGAIWIRDLGSTNGSRLDAARVQGIEQWHEGQALEIGATLLRWTGPEAAASGRVTAREGRLLFNRPPRPGRVPNPEPIVLPTPPDTPSKGRLPLAASLVPIVLGVALALVIGPQFLLFAAMGPVMAVVSFAEDRRSGRTGFKRSSAGFAHTLAQSQETLRESRAAAVRRRRIDAPDPAEIALRIRSTAPTLWERAVADRGHEDFLRLRVGSGDLPSDVGCTVPDRGDGALVRQAATVATESAIDVNVPVTFSLSTEHAVGVVGAGPVTDGLVRWLVLQAAALHSPRDLSIVVLTRPERAQAWEWSAWLPHATLDGLGSDFTAAVCSSASDIARAAELVESVVRERREAGRAGVADARGILLVVDDGAPVDPAVLDRLLSQGPEHGVRGIVVSSDPYGLPGACLTTVTCDDRANVATLTARDRAVGAILPDGIDLVTATELARRLAPLRDVGESDRTTAMPQRIDLVDLLGIAPGDSDGIRARWEHRGDLGAPVGAGAAGPLHIDLRRDGPHGLVAGTTGAGKSELLQSLVVGLAATNPPERLTFVLIDYKGGAAFSACVGLPHTVGFVTDLDGHLAQRALVSLNAELRRREHLLAGSGAKDIVEMESIAPAAAPPNLLIVVDEFAFLKREVPDFVAGLVDVAQRGRSLGVHLVLATQRPAGVIDDNIRANTNLRIALRVGDETDSTDVIGRRDAALLSRSVPGRGFLRTGHGEVREFQAAYVGGTRGGTVDGVRVQPVVLGVNTAVVAGESRTTAATDLDQLVAAVTTADSARPRVALVRPWLPPLGPVYALPEVPRGEVSTLASIIGVADRPELQQQEYFSLDLDEWGHVVVYGASGSGKSTTLRTIATSFAATFPASRVQVYALDMAGGLRGLVALPHVGDVVPGEDVERVERLFAMLEEEIAVRRELLARHGVASHAELRRTTADAPASILFLVDTLNAFVAAFDEVDHGELVERLGRIVSDGRSVGIHVIATADRRLGLPHQVVAGIAGRIVLRMATDDDYLALGLPQLRGVEPVPGRGFAGTGLEVQLVVVGGDASGAAQNAAVADLGARLDPVENARPRPVRLLPDRVSVGELGTPVPGRVVVGLDAQRHQPCVVDLERVPTFLVAGPHTSGLTTALATVARQFQTAHPDSEVHVLAPRRADAQLAALSADVAVGVDACASVAAQLAALVRARVAGGTDRPMLVVVDDAEELGEGAAAAALEAIVKRGRDVGVTVIAAADVHSVLRAYGGWLAELKKGKQGVLLWADPIADGDVFGVRLPRKQQRSQPAGRGYLVRRGAVELVQIAVS